MWLGEYVESRHFLFSSLSSSPSNSTLDSCRQTVLEHLVDLRVSFRHSQSTNPIVRLTNISKMSDLASRITKPDEAVKVESQPEAEAPAADASVAEAQNDGAIEELGGSGLQEPEWDVEVSLSDLQNNEATPFHSATQWEDMGL